MIHVTEAKKLIEENHYLLPPVKFPLEVAQGLVLAEDIFAITDIPAYPQSSMDGYAFKFEDRNSPLQMIGEMAAGTSEHLTINKGECTRIFTGAPLPEGADTVVMQEKISIDDGKILIKDEQIETGLNVRPKGAEVQKGSLAMSKNTLLTPAACGFLAGIGMAEVAVYPKPKMALILTGNELVNPGNLLQFGQVYEACSFIYKAALTQIGIPNLQIIQVPDSSFKLEQALENALHNYDVVMLTGGVSVGEYDFVVDGASACGVQQIFHKIKQRPGKPMYFGRKENKFVFGLPGNPSSGLVCYYQYVQPFLEAMMGKQSSLKSVTATLTHDYKKGTNLTHFLKGNYQNGKATPLFAQESYRLASFAEANCLIILEEEKDEFKVGDEVEVCLI